MHGKDKKYMDAFNFLIVLNFTMLTIRDNILKGYELCPDKYVKRNKKSRIIELKGGNTRQNRV